MREVSECRTCYRKYYSAVSWLYGLKYRGADKSLARPWKETSYSDRDLQHYTNTYGVQTTGITIPRLRACKEQEYIPVVCTP